MAVTVTHRHVHVPWTPIIAALVAVAVAITLIALINNETGPTTEEITANPPVAVPGAAVVAKPEPAAWHQHAELVVEPLTPPITYTYPRNHVQGTTLLNTDTGPTAPYVDPYPFNHFMGEP